MAVQNSRQAAERRDLFGDDVGRYPAHVGLVAALALELLAEIRRQQCVTQFRRDAAGDKDAAQGAQRRDSTPKAQTCLPAKATTDSTSAKTMILGCSREGRSTCRPISTKKTGTRKEVMGSMSSSSLWSPLLRKSL